MPPVVYVESLLNPEKNKRPCANPGVPWRGSGGGKLAIKVGGKEEHVEVDPVSGPQVYLLDGSLAPISDMAGRRWCNVSPPDQKLLAYKAARRNVSVKAEVGEDWMAQPTLCDQVSDPMERTAARCRAEQEKPPVCWSPVSVEGFKGNHSRTAPGMIYGLDFPWSPELLIEFGPKWLTRAFRAAGTLSSSNRVVSVVLEKTIKVTGGNNAGKFLFEVEYANFDVSLDTKLFAKVPFAVNKATENDRISSSVYKQTMDLYEINTYRLLEACLPMKTPKYYFGDISNATTNYILITARIPFAEFAGKRKGDLRPFEIEGPYDKCKDHLLRGDQQEYYTLLVQSIAKVAGLHKSGKFAREDVLEASLGGCVKQDWGMNPDAPTGENPVMVKRKLDAAVKFFSDTARHLFPAYAANEDFQQKFVNTMMKWSAYQTEVAYWKVSMPDHVALGHANLNADNAYYWRDNDGKLDCGVFDWGGFGQTNIGHKIWWTFNCADFDQFKANYKQHLATFISTYATHGGPTIDEGVLSMALLLTTLENAYYMVASVPNCFKMCALSEWATIKDRHDPRVADDIDGKSTLRTTLTVLNNALRAIEEMAADENLERWIQDVYVANWGNTAKTPEMIFG